MTQQNRTNQDELQKIKNEKTVFEKKLQNLSPPWWAWVAAALVGLFASIIVLDLKAESPTELELFSVSFIYILVFLFAFYIIVWLRKKEIRDKVYELDYKLTQMGATELKENIQDDFFTKLVQINFKYIDQYYLQTHMQANKSFKLALAASIIGFLIIIFGVIMMFFNYTDAAFITTAAGVIAESIAAIFFYLYNKTILKMSEYHQKLVITQNVSLALKITEDMKDESIKAATQKDIVDRLTMDINKYLTGNMERE